MKGLIVYSSITGNTKKVAEVLGERLADIGEWTVQTVAENPSTEGYDVILVGGWVDKGLLNPQCQNYFDAVPKGDAAVGVFATMGAMPDSFHGKKCYANLEELLVGHRSLGVALLPGLVAPALIARVEKMTDDVLPKDIREQMIDAGKDSRYANEEELQAAVELFKKACQSL